MNTDFYPIRLGAHILQPKRRGEGSLFVRHVTPHQPTSGLVFVHGSMVHSEYYLPWALDLAQQGVKVFLPDLRGHGRSSGPRGTVRRFEDHVADVMRIVLAMRQSHPELPVYLGGESYGALIAFIAAAAPEIALHVAGLVLASPAFGLQAELSPRLRTAIRWGSAWLPFLRPLRPMPFEGVTHHADATPIVYADRLVVRRYTIRFLGELLRAQDIALETAPFVIRPVLAFLAEEDRIVDNRAADRVFAKLAPPLTRMVLPGAWHALTVEAPAVLTEHLLSFTAHTAQDMTAFHIERTSELPSLTTSWIFPRVF